MAAATSWSHGVIPEAVRTKQVRQRTRESVGGAFGRAEQAASTERRREEGRLDGREYGDLLLLWVGLDGSGGCRSVHGAVQDRLMRSPPTVNRALEEQVERELLSHGPEGVARDKLVDLIAAENPKTRWSGATRYEIRRCLRGMVDGERAEFFVARQKRAKRQKRDDVEMVTGPEAPQNSKAQKPEGEEVGTEMVRLARRAKQPFPRALVPAERWAREDAELEASWRMIAVHEAPGGAGPRESPPVPELHAARALRRMDYRQRHVIETAYGGAASRPYLAAWREYGEDVMRLVPETAAAERARRELVAARSTPESRETVDRQTTAADAIRAKVDAAPEGAAERARWREERAAFVERARRDAEEMLAVAVRAYRKARG